MQQVVKMTSKCGACGQFQTGGAVCYKCKISFHHKCVRLPSKAPENWKCPGCIAATPKQDNTNTPIKAQEDIESLSSPEGQDANPQHVLLQEIRGLRADMNSFRKDFNKFREEICSEINELRVRQNDITERFDGFCERFAGQEAKLDDQEARLQVVCKETTELKVEIAHLKRELQERDQIALQNDLEIRGVTEEKGESIFHVMGLLTAKLGMKVDERDIVDVRRVGPVRAGPDANQRPRPIVLRVARRAMRDQVLRAARSRRGLTTADIELAGAPRPIYVNERLSKENRGLFSKARAMCKQHCWKFAWTREGVVFVRKADGEPAFRIRDEREIDRIFKK